MYSRDIVFGDGMTEITAPPQEIEVFDIRRPKARKEERPAMTIREALIVASCAAPVVLGITFLTVMIQHTALYLIYWVAVWAWLGLVIYANTKTRRREWRTGALRRGRTKRKCFTRHYSRRAARFQ